MKIIYKNEKVKKYCTDLKTATRILGGNKSIAQSLMSRINALGNAECIEDIIRMPNFRFHKLGKKKRDLRGYYAIDVKSKKEQWRIILQPLDENELPYGMTKSIDQIAKNVRIVEITEVSKHYE